MPDATDIANDGFPQKNRLTRRETLPGVGTGRFLSSNVLGNIPSTATVLGPYTVGNGSTLTITSTIAASNSGIILGVVPYSIVFFQTSLDTTLMIPSGSSIVQGNYYTYGPFSMANFTPGGSNGNNVVFKTSLYNNSGGSKTIYAITQSRVFVPSGIGVAGVSVGP